MWAFYMLYDYFLAKLKDKVNDFATERMAIRLPASVSPTKES